MVVVGRHRAHPWAAGRGADRAGDRLPGVAVRRGRDAVRRAGREAVVALEIDRLAGPRRAAARRLPRLDTDRGRRGAGAQELRIAGVDARAAARGRVLLVPVRRRPGQTAAAMRSGPVVRVEPNGGIGMLVVQRGQEEVQIPLTPALCPVLRPDRIVVRPPEGLLDLNTPGPKRRAHRHRDHLSRHGAGRPQDGVLGRGVASGSD